MFIVNRIERTYDTLGDICPIFERPELCFKAAVTILVCRVRSIVGCLMKG